MDTINGVQRYDDASTGRVIETPAGYSDVWIRRGSNERIVVSSDPTFNPNAGDTATWERLTPVE